MATRISATCSAPGKVILFGEHAVVYGVTAIAAALSDLRLFADIDSTEEDNITFELHDFKLENGDSFVYSLSTSTLRTAENPIQGLANTPSNPTEVQLSYLRKLFEDLAPLPAQCIMAGVFLACSILPELIQGTMPSGPQGIKISIRSVGLPIGAGLGSSAAFSVAVSGALVRYRVKTLGALTAEDETAPASLNPSPATLKIINAWSYASEVVIHGNPSGLDNTTSCFGGAVKFSRSSGQFETLEALPPIRILLTNTKVPRSTKLLVAGVRVRYDSYPAVIKPVMDAIEGLSQRFLAIVERAKIDSEGEGQVFQKEMNDLVSMNSHLLGALGVGHVALSTVTLESEKRGLSSKLTGAGGGGCAITLLPQPTDGSPSDQTDAPNVVDDLKASLRAHGFDCFESAIGGQGLTWHQ